MFHHLRIWIFGLALVTAMGMSAAFPAAAVADGCGDCKDRCRDEVDKCKNAAPKRLCKGPAGAVCKFFKDFNCPNMGTYCRKVGCEVGGPCGGPPPGGGGQVSGEPHIYSHDRMRYDFQQVGEYLAARSEKADFEMQVRLARFSAGASVVKMAGVRADGHVVVFEAGKGIIVDEQSMMLDESTIYVSEKVSVTYVSKSRYLFQADDTNIWVTIKGSHLDLYLELDPQSKGSWHGLLGDYDGEPDNDFKTREGKLFEQEAMTRELLYGEFGDSWRLSQEESFLIYGEGENTETFSDESFPESHRSIADFDKATFDRAQATCIAKGVLHGEALRNCIYDVGVSGSEVFAESYALAIAGEAKGSLEHPGELGMHVQENSYQGAAVPLYWSGAVGEKVQVELHTGEGKKVASHQGKGENPMLFRLPADVGEYTLKLSQGDKKIEKAISVGEAKASISAPDTVAGATDFSVSWTGPLGRGDFVSLAKAGETDANKYLAYIWANRSMDASFQAPAEPGDYEIRYALQGARGRSIIAKKTIKVTEAQASLMVPEAIGAGAAFDVAWTGPDGGNDYIDLVTFGHTKTSGGLMFRWTSQSKEGNAKLLAPTQAGKYSVRYIASTSAGRAVLATETIRVSEVRASINAPDTVEGAKEFTFSWTGPEGKGDYIALVKAGETNAKSHLAYLWVSRKKAPYFQAPATKGDYELWYVLSGAGGQRTPIAKKPIKVTEAKAVLSPPSEVVVGSYFQVALTGPNGRSDLVDINPAGQESSVHSHLTYAWVKKSKLDAVKLRAPSEPGTYMLRYIASTSVGRAVITSATMKVTDAKATLSLPATAIAGEKIEVSWTGPRQEGDLVAFLKPGKHKRVSYFAYVWAEKKDKGMLKAPDEPGTYEVAYVLRGGDKRRVLTRTKIVVKAK